MARVPIVVVVVLFPSAAVLFGVVVQLCERALRRERFKKNIYAADVNLFELERDMQHDPLLALSRAIASKEEVCAPVPPAVTLL